MHNVVFAYNRTQRRSMLVDWETRSTNNHEEAQQHTAAATNSTLQVQMLNLPEATENHTAIPTHQDIKIMNSIESQDDSCQIVVAASTACLLSAPREGGAAAAACLLSAPREGGPTAEAYTRTAPSLISPPPSEKAMAGEPQAVRKPPSAPRKSRKKAN